MENGEWIAASPSVTREDGVSIIGSSLCERSEAIRKNLWVAAPSSLGKGRSNREIREGREKDGGREVGGSDNG